MTLLFYHALQRLSSIDCNYFTYSLIKIKKQRRTAIKGDYKDLNSLYDSLCNYVGFYIDNIILDCNEEDKQENEKNRRVAQLHTVF